MCNLCCRLCQQSQQRFQHSAQGATRDLQKVSRRRLLGGNKVIVDCRSQKDRNDFSRVRVGFAAAIDSKILARSRVDSYATSHTAVAMSQDSANAMMGKNFDRFDRHQD